jgi:ArsR family transcriptional regulator
MRAIQNCQLDPNDDATTFQRQSNCGVAALDAHSAVDALSALAHEHRLAAYRLLVETGPAGLPAGLIAERLGLPPSSLTFHLQSLLHAGLVTQHRASRQLIYAMVPAAMNDLVAYLTEHCCGGAVGCAVACDPAAAHTFPNPKLGTFGEEDGGPVVGAPGRCVA